MKNSDNKAMFFGKVTASVTHEIQNVLAIIKETSGLMEDFIQLNKMNGLEDFEDKVDKCLETIKKQAYRGVLLTSDLNSFAHTTDNIQASVDVYDISKKLIRITDRLYKQKNVEVEICECETSYSVLTDPVIFQMILFSCVDCIIENTAIHKVSVQVQPRNNAGGLTFLFTNEDSEINDIGEKIKQSSQWPTIIELCKLADFTPHVDGQQPALNISF